MRNGEILIRDVVRGDDPANVKTLVDSSGFFHKEEIDVAVELVEETLAKGPAAGYHFLFAEKDGKVIGYTCFGPIACTQSSYDLYWIATLNSERGLGVGKKLLAESEQRIKAMGGTRVYIETSSRPLYEPTRQFYLRCEYAVDAVLQDFYAPGDGKYIFVKSV